MRFTSLLIVAMLSVASVFAAKAPTDEQLKSLCREAGVAVASVVNESEKQEAFNGVAAKYEKQADMTRISAQQVDMIFEFGGLPLDRQLRNWLFPTLEMRAAKEPIFAFYAWKYMPENDGFSHGQKETEALIRFLSAKNLQQTINEQPDILTDIFNAMPTLRDANWHTAGFADAVTHLMECSLPEMPAMDCVKVFNSVARVDTIDQAIREKMRTLCLNNYKSLASKVETARKQKACQEQITYLEGPFACGTLVGNKAPELHFLRMWYTDGDSIVTKEVKTLSELKGKVIMLDFWGTKCVPCIQSFPEIAEIQQHFAEKDVIILGVTSLQGFFYDLPNKRTVQCRNNPEKELSLFPGFMKGMNMTWTVAVSEEDVMNTDYGALAIPHVVIIDKEGNVRHNAVNADKETKIKLIEELLD